MSSVGVSLLTHKITYWESLVSSVTQDTGMVEFEEAAGALVATASSLGSSSSPWGLGLVLGKVYTVVQKVTWQTNSTAV